MKIILDNCGRRFNQDWIFRKCSFTFNPGDRWAILGPNGSGKSTLMSLVLGSLSPSEGKVKYFADTAVAIDIDEAYKNISFAAPYIDLIEEFTLAEAIRFNFNFKPYLAGLNYEMVLEVLNLAKAADKPLKYFSSGMKQRTKLALAFCSETPVLLLDEPTSNLDIQGIDWYLNLTERFTGNKLFIVASNQKHEYDFCHNFVDILDYKPV